MHLSCLMQKSLLLGTGTEAGAPGDREGTAALPLRYQGRTSPWPPDSRPALLPPASLSDDGVRSLVPIHMHWGFRGTPGAPHPAPTRASCTTLDLSLGAKKGLRGPTHKCPKVMQNTKDPHEPRTPGFQSFPPPALEQAHSLSTPQCPQMIP